MIKNIGQKTILSNGLDATWNRGEIKIPEDTQSGEMRVKVTAQILNKGTTVTSLTSNHKDALLGHTSWDLQVGPEGNLRRPFALQPGTILRLVERDQLGVDTEGYSDSTTGLGQTLATGTPSVPGVTTVVWRQSIPVGEMMRLDGAKFGMGRFEWLLTQLYLKRGSEPLTGISADLSVGSVTYELDPKLDQVNGSPYHFPPEYEELNPIDRRYTFPDGLMLSLNERTAAQASTALQEYRLQVDDEIVHDQAAPSDVKAEYARREKRYPYIENVEDKVTRLYATAPGTPLERVRTGRVTFEQKNQDLNPMKFASYMQKVPSEKEIAAVVQAVANLLKPGMSIKAVSWAAVEGRELESRLLPFVPMVFFDTNDSQYGQFPGLVCERGGSPRVEIPLKRLLELRAEYKRRQAAKDPKRVEKLIQLTAGAIPGAVIGGRGFKSGPSGTYAQVRRLIVTPDDQLPELQEALKALAA